MFNTGKQQQNMEYIMLTDLGVQKAIAIKPCEFSVNKTSLSYLLLFWDGICLRGNFLK